VVVGELGEQLGADPVGLDQLAVAVEQQQTRAVGCRPGGSDGVQQQRPAEPGRDGLVDLGDEGGLVLGELRPAPVAEDAEAAPAAAFGHERGAQLLADAARAQQLAEPWAGLGVAVGRLAQQPDRPGAAGQPGPLDDVVDLVLVDRQTRLTGSQVLRERAGEQQRRGVDGVPARPVPRHHLGHAPARLDQQGSRVQAAVAPADDRLLGTAAPLPVHPPSPRGVVAMPKVRRSPARAYPQLSGTCQAQDPTDLG
jgi:hypothetical protein